MTLGEHDQLNICIHKGSYTSDHVLLNLLNELGKKIRCKALSNILSFSPTSLINSVKRKHECKILFFMALKLRFISKFCIKTSRFRQ